MGRRKFPQERQQTYASHCYCCLTLRLVAAAVVAVRERTEPRRPVASLEFIEQRVARPDR